MLKGIAYGFGAGVLITLALYFFWHVPEVKEAYNRGRSDCLGQPDSIFIPGKDSIVYKDKLVYPAETNIVLDTNQQKYIQTATFVSEDNDSIKIKVTTTDVEALIELAQYKKMEVMPSTDTVKIYYPKMITLKDTATYSPFEIQPFSLSLGLAASLVYLFLISLVTAN